MLGKWELEYILFLQILSLINAHSKTTLLQMEPEFTLIALMPQAAPTQLLTPNLSTTQLQTTGPLSNLTFSPQPSSTTLSQTTPPPMAPLKLASLTELSIKVIQLNLLTFLVNQLQILLCLLWLIVMTRSLSQILHLYLQ